MKDPLFLRLHEIIEIHSDQIARYGGSHGIRDMGLLQSAVATPMSSFGGQFLHSDLFEMAAAYLYHLVKNHAFVDGNKRVGTLAALVFLELNGIEVDAEETEFERVILDVIANKSSKSAVAEFLRQNSKLEQK
jgi:death on curing protein